MLSYSQNGEDIVLSYLFHDVRDGFYIDVGCNHPVIGNNTFNFYLAGWRSINIDGNQKLIDLYCKDRPGDISLCKLVSDTKK